MNPRTEGTIVLDGLIEGRFSNGQETEEKLRGWASFVRSALGLNFSLDTSGDSFNMLPDDKPTSAKALGGDPQDAIQQAIEQLIEALPAPDRASVFSTLRSSEARKNEEVQSIYAVRPDGTVTVESRTVEASTVAAPEALTVKQRVVFGAIGLAIAAAIIGLVLILFPGLREKVGDTIKPAAVEDVTLEVATFEKYFTVELKDISRTRALLSIKPTAAYPLTSADLDKAYAEAKTLSERLTIEALARGYVSIEYYTDENSLYRWESSPIPKQISSAIRAYAKKLAEATDSDDPPKPLAIELSIVVSPDGRQRIGRIVIGF